MNDKFDNSDIQWNKKAAQEEIDNLKNIRATSWEQHSHSFKWLMASLLALNGGACLAIIDHEGIPAATRMLAGSMFLVGIVGALLIAVFGQQSIQRGMAPIQRQIGYWMTVANDGERVESMENSLADELKGAMRFGLGARLSGWVAALAFLAGAGIAGSSLTDEPSNPLAIQVQSAKSLER